MVTKEFSVLDGRFRFVEPHPDYAPSYFANISGDKNLTRYTPWCTHRTLAQAQARLNLMAGTNRSGAGRYWLITPGEDDPRSGECIGVICSRWDNDYSRDVNFILNPVWRGQGIIAQAIPVLCDGSFFRKETRRVWSLGAKDNLALSATLEKAGFEREAVLRRHTLFPNLARIPSDAVMYSRMPQS